MNLDIKTSFTDRRSLLATAATVALSATAAHGVDTFWDGSDSTDWATGANWDSGNVPTIADKAFVNDISVNTPQVTADATVSELLVGFTGSTGTVDVTSGTLTSDGWTVIGNGSGGNGTVNLTGSGSLATNAGFGNFQIAEVGGSTGLVNVNTSGSLTANGDMIVGNGGDGSLVVQAGTVNVGGDMILATNGNGQGTVDIQAGSVNVGGVLALGRNSNTSPGSGIVDVAAGASLSVENDIDLAGYAGDAAHHKLNINGGTVDVASTTERWVKIGQWDAHESTLDVNNGGSLDLNAGTDIKMGWANGNVSGTHIIQVDGAGSAINGTGAANGDASNIEMGRVNTTGNYQLNIQNGGQVNIQAIYTNADSTSAIVNFDGGTLQALGDDANWIRLNGGGTREVNVLAGGATLDTNSFNVTIGNSMTGAGDLTVEGGGTLTLEGAASSVNAASVSASTLLITGQLGTTAGTSVDATGSIGGNGTLVGDLTLAAGATIDISLGALNVDPGATVLFNGLELNDIAGLDLGTAASGTYSVLAGAFTIDGSSSISNLGEGNALDLGSGRSAWFETGSLSVVVVPEPSVAFLGGLGVFALLRRRRRA